MLFYYYLYKKFKFFDNLPFPSVNNYKKNEFVEIKINIKWTLYEKNQVSIN
jgi:hypothetical protein